MTCPCNRRRHAFLGLRNRLYEEQMQTQDAIIDAILFHSFALLYLCTSHSSGHKNPFAGRLRALR